MDLDKIKRVNEFMRRPIGESLGGRAAPEQPAQTGRQVEGALRRGSRRVQRRARGERERSDERRREEDGHEVAQNLVREELYRVEASAQGVEERAVSPEIRVGLRDDAHAHAELLGGLPVRLLRADGRGLVDRAESLLDHLRRDDEVAARLVVERHVGRAPHRVQTARSAYERARAALVRLQKSLVAPVRLRAASDRRARVVYVD